MFDSFGLGEWGIVAVIAILFLDPKKVGVAGRAWIRFRKKWSEIQREVKQQFNSIVEDENLKDNPGAIRSAKAALRVEGRNAARALPAVDRVEAAAKILEKVKEWPTFQQAKIVAAFAGTQDELDTEGLLRHVIATGKTLLLPYVAADGDGTSRIAMVAVRNYDQDLQEGAFGILEPRPELRVAASEPDLILVPGLAFDESGGRLGHGRGFYDRYLRGRGAIKAGLAFDAQVIRKKLALEAHDQLLDGLVTERRLLVFSQPRIASTPEISTSQTEK